MRHAAILRPMLVLHEKQFRLLTALVLSIGLYLEMNELVV